MAFGTKRCKAKGCGARLDSRAFTMPDGKKVVLSACPSCDRRRCEHCKRPTGDLYVPVRGDQRCDHCGKPLLPLAADWRA